MLALAIVNAAAPAPPCLKALIGQTTAEGREVPSRGELDEKYLKVAGMKVRVAEVRREESSDGLTHAFSVALDSGVVRCLIFSAHDKQLRKKETYYFRTTVAGALESALRFDGRNDAAGKPIPGSAEYTVLDVRDREVGKRFKRELDFWLKGKYRKSAEKNPANKK